MFKYLKKLYSMFNFLIKYAAKMKQVIKKMFWVSNPITNGSKDISDKKINVITVDRILRKIKLLQGNLVLGLSKFHLEQGCPSPRRSATLWATNAFEFSRQEQSDDSHQSCAWLTPAATRVVDCEKKFYPRLSHNIMYAFIIVLRCL